MIVNVVSPVVWISPGAVALVPGFSSSAVTVLGDGGATAPVGWISPARAITESAHARENANAKRLILSVSPLRLRNASTLARKHDSVNTYKTIDTASCAMTNIRALAKRLLYAHDKGFIFREDSLT